MRFLKCSTKVLCFESLLLCAFRHLAYGNSTKMQSNIMPKNDNTMPDYYLYYLVSLLLTLHKMTFYSFPVYFLEFRLVNVYLTEFSVIIKAI